MKFALVATVVLLGLAVSHGRTLEKTKNVVSRTFGNFGPKLKPNFEVNPASQFGLAQLSHDPIAIAKLYVSLRSNVAADSVRVTSSHTSKHNGVTHVYLQQVINGLDVTNAVANVNIDAAGKILSVGNSFFTKAIPAAAQAPKLSATQAVLGFAKLLNLEAKNLHELKSQVAKTTTVSGAKFALKPIPAELKYIQLNDGASVSLVWSILVEMKDNMYNAHVDATTGEVLSLMDWVADASYKVYPLGINDPHSGDRVVVQDPAHPVASPNGWHAQGDSDTFTDTVGNNVYAQENHDGFDDYINNYRPDGGAALNFDFPINFNQDPEEYVDAVITNLFYWNNIIHDLLYVYGFDEESGNFQDDNLGRGGEENDSVIANAQDGSGYNNANFMTPPDGEQGRMRMYVWTASNPYRDGDLDGGIVMHEYAHGLSTRLTGGPSDVSCLGFGESGGMGEGWGDFLSTITRTTESSTRADVYAMGDYSANDPAGIRNYKYSTDMSVNPSTYAYLGRAGYSGVHAIGEVWAVILYDVFWNVVEKNGFDPDWFNVNGETPASSPTFTSLRTGQKEIRGERKQAGVGGNVIMFQLVIDGMKLQPCDPTFVDARDAILQADELNNNGDNKCALWTAFAKRGLGVNAEGSSSPWFWNGEEDFEVPAECA